MQYSNYIIIQGRQKQNVSDKALRRVHEIAYPVPFDPPRKNGKWAGFETRSLPTRYASK